MSDKYWAVFPVDTDEDGDIFFLSDDPELEKYRMKTIKEIIEERKMFTWEEYDRQNENYYPL